MLSLLAPSCHLTHGKNRENMKEILICQIMVTRMIPLCFILFLTNCRIMGLYVPEGKHFTTKQWEAFAHSNNKKKEAFVN